ncbi:uncharacterized protein LOC127780786 [Oryza glaberrima]|uniref:Uncharacterized protein n=2 Tax=Oryza TaxID=4527 RepID=A0A0D3GM88_9ORYZ|nr:uncharacterized protein LOC127780786 [Oryza glaberrima]
MAVRALVSKLRIPAAASRRALPPFRSFSAASQDKVGGTTARAAAKEGTPISDNSRKIEKFYRKLRWYQALGNFLGFNTSVYLFYRYHYT